MISFEEPLRHPIRLGEWDSFNVQPTYHPRFNVSIQDLTFEQKFDPTQWLAPDTAEDTQIWSYVARPHCASCHRRATTQICDAV